MKIVFHEDYCKVYSSDPAAAPGRIESILEEAKGYGIVKPEAAGKDDILLIHTPSHLNYVKSVPEVYEVAVLRLEER